MKKIYIIFKNGNELLLDKVFLTSKDAKIYGDHLLSKGNILNYYIY